MVTTTFATSPAVALRPRGVITSAARASPRLLLKPSSTRVALPFSRRPAPRHGAGTPAVRGAVAARAAAFPSVTAPTDEDLPPTDNKFSELHQYIHRGLGSAVLLAATALSLFLANSFFAPGWCGLWGAAVGPALGGYQLSMQGWVNEGLMALFFFVLGLEAKREVCYGTLSNMKAAMLPCLAALGGLLVPVALFSMLNLGSQGLMQGWAIPVATDLAFAMAILGFFRNKMPQSAPTFLFAIATATNIAAVATIPAYFNSIVSIPYLTAAATLAVSMFLLPKLVKKVSAWMYAVGGAALWYCLLLSGASAGAAGVVAALAIPAAQLAPATSNAVGRQQGQTLTLIDHLIHNISPYTALIVLPMFALANTAVPIDASLLGYLFAKPVALGIMAGLLLGKPIGIAAFSLLGVKLGVAEMPRGMTTKHLAVLSLLGSVSFTMSLVLISLALVGYPDSTRLSKVALLAASAVAGIASAAVMYTIHPASEVSNEEVEHEQEEAHGQAYAAQATSHATYPDAAPPLPQQVAASGGQASEEYRAGYDRGYYDGYYYGYAAAAPAQPAASSADAYASTQQNGAAAPAAGNAAQPSEEYKAGYDRGYYDGYYYGYAAAEAAAPSSGNGATSAPPDTAPPPMHVSAETAQAASHLETLLPASEEASAPAAPTPAAPAPTPSPVPEPSAPASTEAQYTPEQLAFMERRKQELEKYKTENA